MISCDFKKANFSYCDLTCARLSQFEHVSAFNPTLIGGANFKNAILRGALILLLDFTDCNLEGAELANQVLSPSLSQSQLAIVHMQNCTSVEDWNSKHTRKLSIEDIKKQSYN
jgi:uncharacterized protein YjbI with pentapeptide repeats